MDVPIDPSEIARIQKVDIKPLNAPEGLRYSYSKGNPIIEFQFAGRPALLRTSTLRLNGTLRVATNATTPVVPDNNDLKGTSANDNVGINDRVGVHSVFQNILISNGLGSSLESVRNYPRMLATLLPTALSFDDFTVQQTLGFANVDATRNALNQEVNFSIPLLTGLLGSQQLIPLEQIGDGLRIQLELSPDKQVIYNVTQGDGDTTADDFVYDVSNLSMTADVIVPTEQAQVKLQRQTSGSLVYQAYQSLYSTITASDTTLSYTLNSSKVLSIFHNFIETPFVNNFRKDGLATDMLHKTSGVPATNAATLKKVTFIKNGVKYPNEFDLETELQSKQGNPETQAVMSHLNAVVPLYSMRNTLNQPLLLPNNAQTEDVLVDDHNGPNTCPLATTTRRRNFALGTAFDCVSQQGINMKGQNYQVRVQTDLTGNCTSGVYTYVLARNVINYSPQGVLVST